MKKSINPFRLVLGILLLCAGIMATSCDDADIFNGENTEQGGENIEQGENKEQDGEENKEQDGEENKQDITLRGCVQKGQFVKGSQITAFGLDSNLAATGKSWPSNIIDASGSFTINAENDSKFIELRANGYYFNELTGDISDGVMTLEAIVDPETENVNINILTHLVRPRIKKLIHNGLDFSTAKNQAETELLSALGYSSMDIAFDQMDITKSREADALLLALACALQTGRTTGQLVTLLNEISLYFEQAGELSEDHLSVISEGKKKVNSEEVYVNMSSYYKANSMTDIAVPEFYKYIHNDSEFFISGWLSSDYETVPSLGHTGGSGTFHVFSMNKFDIVSDSDLLQFSIEHIWGPLYDVNWTVSNNQTEDDILITAYIKNASGITMREMKLSVRGNYVELTCSLMGDTKSLVLENGFLNLSGDDFVDVNGVNYPIKGNGTPIFTVKVPISDSYVVSYPADAVTFYSDGGHFVHYPNTYEGQGYGVYIGKIQEPEYNTCYLKAMHGMLQLRILNIEDWKHIAFRSNDGTAICGDAVLDSDHNILYVNNGSDEITFVRENSDDPNAYLPVLPCTLSGLTITIYKSDDTQIVKTYSNTLNIRSGYLISIGL